MEVEFSKENFILPEIKYEYLDHTADVQLHAWGDSLKEAFEQCGMAMFGYMTDLDYVTVHSCYKIEAKGDDIDGLLFHFLDELLFLFSAEPFLICKRLEITKFDLETFDIECHCYGEPFDLEKHPQGTEVKAITYSAMQIVQEPERNHFEVILHSLALNTHRYLFGQLNIFYVFFILSHINFKTNLLTFIASEGSRILSS